jgi:hypothetical protein
MAFDHEQEFAVAMSHQFGGHDPLSHEKGSWSPVVDQPEE